MADEKDFQATSLDNIFSQARTRDPATGRFQSAGGPTNEEPDTDIDHTPSAEEIAALEAADGNGDAQEAQGAEGAAAGKTGDEAGQQKPSTTQPKDAQGKPPQTPVAATTGERKRRQDAEARAKAKDKDVSDRDTEIAALKKQLEDLKKAQPATGQQPQNGQQQQRPGTQQQQPRRPAPQQPAPQRTSVFEDEEKFAGQIEERASTRAAAQAWDMHLVTCEEITRSQHDDFEDVMGTQYVTDDDGDEVPRHNAWIELRNRRPDLAAKFNRSANPVRFAYEAVKADRAQAEAAKFDPEAERARIRAEIAAELAGQGNGNGQSQTSQQQPGAGGGQTQVQTQARTTPPAPPRSLANGRGVPASGNKAPAFTGPTPLTSIFAQVGKG